jgi:hypothetical protein
MEVPGLDYHKESGFTPPLSRGVLFENGTGGPRPPLINCDVPSPPMTPCFSRVGFVLSKKCESHPYREQKVSITTTTKTRSIRARIALVPALSLGLLAGSAAIAAPAQADNDRDAKHGCTVEALKPSDERGVWVNFKISVNCENGKRTVHIKQVRYEADRGRDTVLGSDYITRDVRGYKTIDSLDKVPSNLDRRGSEEVYHVIWYGVEDDHGKVSKWFFDKSPTLKYVNAHYDR